MTQSVRFEWVDHGWSGNLTRKGLNQVDTSPSVASMGQLPSSQCEESSRLSVERMAIHKIQIESEI